MTTPNYKQVIVDFLLSMHSRRFVLTIFTMALMFHGAKAGIPTETLGVIAGTAAAYVLGESHNDAQRNAAIVAASIPAPQTSELPSPEEIVEESAPAEEKEAESVPAIEYTPEQIESLRNLIQSMGKAQ